MTFPTHQQAPEVLQPCEEALDFPPAFVTPEFAPVLAVRSGAITTMRCDQLDSVLLGKKIVQSVAVIPLVGNQTFRLLGHKAVLDRSVDQFLLMRRSARNPEGDRKTMAVCDCHELAPFADERSTNAIAPFFAPIKEASIKLSSRPSCPRANKSSANAQRMPSSTPPRCHCWKRRWQVWYGRIALADHARALRSATPTTSRSAPAVLAARVCLDCRHGAVLQIRPRA